MQSHYSTFSNFGKAINTQTKPTDSSNPLNYCIFPTLSSQFIHGSASSGLLYDNNNTYCMNFMTEYCEKNWDGYCNAFEAINVDSYYPNTAVIDTTAFQLAQFFLKNNHPSLGDMLLRNVIQRKYIDYPGIEKDVVQFDSNTANSPFITIYSNYTLRPSQLKNLETIPSCPLIQKMLMNPKPCFDVIARLYLGLLRREPLTSYLYQNLLLQDFFKKNQEVLQQFLMLAKTKIPSFQ